MGWEQIDGYVDGATRRARIRAHREFDALWLPLGKRWRPVAYEWLAQQMGKETHMATADIATCLEVVAVCAGMEPVDLLRWKMESYDTRTVDMFEQHKRDQLARLKRDMRP